MMDQMTQDMVQCIAPALSPTPPVCLCDACFQAYIAGLVITWLFAHLDIIRACSFHGRASVCCRYPAQIHILKVNPASHDRVQAGKLWGAESKKGGAQEDDEANGAEVGVGFCMPRLHALLGSTSDNKPPGKRPQGGTGRRR